MYILQPLLVRPSKLVPVGIVSLLVISALLIYYAPITMPPGYSSLSNSISESAAQGLHNAWIARLGFLCFGFAVLWLTSYLKTTWARGVYWMQFLFALFMLSTAAFSHKPWLDGVAVDFTEDFLHSITANGMGFAFAFGVVVRFMQRSKNDILPRLYDATAILAATVLSPIGLLEPSIAGLLQRVMFVIAYLWFAYEAIQANNYIKTRGQPG